MANHRFTATLLNCELKKNCLSDLADQVNASLDICIGRQLSYCLQLWRVLEFPDQILAHTFDNVVSQIRESSDFHLPL